MASRDAQRRLLEDEVTRTTGRTNLAKSNVARFQKERDDNPGVSAFTDQLNTAEEELEEARLAESRARVALDNFVHGRTTTPPLSTPRPSTAGSGSSEPPRRPNSAAVILVGLCTLVVLFLLGTLVFRGGWNHHDENPEGSCVVVVGYKCVMVTPPPTTSPSASPASPAPTASTTPSPEPTAEPTPSATPTATPSPAPTLDMDILAQKVVVFIAPELNKLNEENKAAVLALLNEKFAELKDQVVTDEELKEFADDLMKEFKARRHHHPTPTPGSQATFQPPA